MTHLGVSVIEHGFRTGAIVAQQSEIPQANGTAEVSAASTSRKMVAAILMGGQIHTTATGISVYVCRRGEQFMARGRWNGRHFGETLGHVEAVAVSRLRQIIVEIENGAYQPPSERRGRKIKCGRPAKLTFRELVAAHIETKRRKLGRKSADDYYGRLAHVIEYAESVDVRKRWPHVADVDGSEQFALGLKTSLFQRRVGRNGHPHAEPRPMSPRQIHNVLSAASMVLNDAKQPATNLLPSNFVTRLPGTSSALESPAIRWRPRRCRRKPAQLWWGVVTPGSCACSAGPWFFPSGRKNSGVCSFPTWTRSAVSCGSARGSGGNDFNKAHQSFQITYPAQFDPIVRSLIGGRSAGPLLRRRRISPKQRGGGRRGFNPS